LDAERIKVGRKSEKKAIKVRKQKTKRKEALSTATTDGVYNGICRKT